jgi:hypothetical protein
MHLFRFRQHDRGLPDPAAAEAAFQAAVERIRAWTVGWFGVAAMFVAALVIEVARGGTAPGVILFLATGAGVAIGATATAFWAARTLANLRLEVLGRLGGR